VNEENTDVIQGTLDMLILKTLSLQRLERAGLLDAEWRQTENSRRAKYYRLTARGRKQLQVETADWARRAAAIARLLNAEG
jgi:DNA-binding PadR family transcriptional regulator